MRGIFNPCTFCITQERVTSNFPPLSTLNEGSLLQKFLPPTSLVSVFPLLLVVGLVVDTLSVATVEDSSDSVEPGAAAEKPGHYLSPFYFLPHCLPAWIHPQLAGPHHHSCGHQNHSPFPLSSLKKCFQGTTVITGL